MFELIEKDPDKDAEVQFEKKKALKVIAAMVGERYVYKVTQGKYDGRPVHEVHHQ